MPNQVVTFTVTPKAKSPITGSFTFVDTLEKPLVSAGFSIFDLELTVVTTATKLTSQFTFTIRTYQ